MFSLIITIISIALVAALALATLYYGGSAFNKGSAGAVATQFINEGQQINGAVAIAKAEMAAEGTTVTDLDGLVTANYLTQLPTLFATQGSTSLVIGLVDVSVPSEDVCNEINKRAGHAPADVDGPGEQPGVYGCNVIDQQFYYKF